MLDKIKEWLQIAKQILLYIAGPLMGIGVYIAYLLKSNHELETKLSQAEAEKDIAKDLGEVKNDEEKANALEAEYRHLDDELNHTTGDGK